MKISLGLPEATFSPQMLILPDALVLRFWHLQYHVNVRWVILDHLLDVLLHRQRVHLLKRLIRPAAEVLQSKRKSLFLIDPLSYTRDKANFSIDFLAFGDPHINSFNAPLFFGSCKRFFTDFHINLLTLALVPGLFLRSTIPPSAIFMISECHCQLLFRPLYDFWRCIQEEVLVINRHKNGVSLLN